MLCRRRHKFHLRGGMISNWSAFAQIGGVRAFSLAFSIT